MTDKGDIYERKYIDSKITLTKYIATSQELFDQHLQQLV